MQLFCRHFHRSGFIGCRMQPNLQEVKKNQRGWSLGIPSPEHLFPKQNVNNFIVARIYSFLLPCVIQPKERRSLFLSSYSRVCFRHLHQASAWLFSHLSDCPAVTNVQFPCFVTALFQCWQIQSSQRISRCWAGFFFPLCNKIRRSGTSGEEMNASVTQVEMCHFNFPLALQQPNPGLGGTGEIYLLAAVNPRWP